MDVEQGTGMVVLMYVLNNVCYAKKTNKSYHFDCRKLE